MLHDLRGLSSYQTHALIYQFNGKIRNRCMNKQEFKVKENMQTHTMRY